MRNAYAIDIGTGAVKCVLLARRGRGARVASFSHVPIEGEGGEQEALARIVAEQGLSGRKVALSLPASLAYLRKIDSPVTDARALRSTIKAQVEPLVPVDIDEAVVDFVRLSGAASGRGTIPILACVLPKDALRRKIDGLRSLGVKTVRTSISALDAYAVLRAMGDGEGHHLLLDLGAKTSNVILYDGAGLLQVRACRVGASGLEGGGGAVESFAEKISAEVARMLKGAGAGTPTSIAVTGGGSMVSGVIDALGRSLNAPVSQASPADQLMPGADDEEQRPFNGLGLPAAGAAHSLLFPRSASLNLQQEEFGEPGLLVKVRRPIALCAVTVLVACGVGNALLLQPARAARSRIRVTQEALDGLWRKLHPSGPLPSNVAETIRTDHRQLTTQDADSLLPLRKSAIDLLLAVVKHLPRQQIVEVTRVSVAQDRIQMDVRARSFSAAQDIAQSISEDPQFSATVRDLKPLGDNTFAFQLTVLVKGGAAGG